MNRRRVGYYVFPSRVFASHSIKNFPRVTLVFQKSYGVEFFSDNRSITILSTFFSHTAENFRRGAFLSFTKWCPKILWTKGGRENHIFLLKIFGLISEKFRMGTLQCVTIFGYWKNFILKRVMSRFSVELFLSHRTEKLRNKTLLCFRKFLV